MYVYAHIIRADDLDLMKKMSMHQDGTRRKALHRRVGRPRSKWHTVTRKHYISLLISKGIILRNWQLDPEFDYFIVKSANDRHI